MSAGLSNTRIQFNKSSSSSTFYSMDKSSAAEYSGAEVIFDAIPWQKTIQLLRTLNFFINPTYTYITDLCWPSLSAGSIRHLRSAEHGLHHVPFARTSATQSQPSPWLALWYRMVSLWLLPEIPSATENNIIRRRWDWKRF